MQFSSECWALHAVMAMVAMCRVHNPACTATNASNVLWLYIDVPQLKTNLFVTRYEWLIQLDFNVRPLIV